MKVSVITVCKNSEKTIERSIQSLVTQTYPQIEYIVIDGDSTDRTKSIIEQYGDRITYFISEPDNGIYAAMNKGIQLATGNILYFLNSDDYLYDPNVIHDVVHFLADRPEYDFLYGDHEARFNFGKSSIHKPATPDQILKEMVCLGECFIQPASFFKAALFQKLGLFNESYNIAGDYEWFTRLLQNNTLQLGYYPRTIVSYAHGGASSHIRPLFEEVFAIQNQVPLYQEPDWLNQRLVELQKSFIDKYDRLEKTHYLSQKREQRIIYLESQEDALQVQVSTLRDELEKLKAGGLARRIWRKFKRLISN
ncbi:MAG: glycosyltransferase [Timaviella obliquedivisa GSE-PSE-MK23-08B]|jgi:glycosyltransferase involved in cell wall biosynthesis|nr:glycosyltransferase [Timaviella obliquedivisa GSE-PSE-MK23-08B]